MLTDRIVKKDVVRGKYEYIEDRDMSLIYVNADGKVVTTKGTGSNEERLYLMFSQMEHFALGYI